MYSVVDNFIGENFIHVTMKACLAVGVGVTS